VPDAADSDVIISDKDYAALVRDASQGIVSATPLEGGLAVLLPAVKWGPDKLPGWREQAMLGEACELAGSVKGVTVVDKIVVKVPRIGKNFLFGDGQLEKIQAWLNTLRNCQTVLVNVDVLPLHLIRDMEMAFKRRVVDRQWLVLAIFHQQARTGEAKMNVALAELPYIRNHRLSHETERVLINNRIRRIEVALQRIAKHRARVTENRKALELPTVAVIGYTNAGKTSLISALCNEPSLESRDAFFTTLNVTAHSATLRCGLEFVLLDTMGFVHRMGDRIARCFESALRDVASADVILHIRDVSHPDRVNQHDCVMAALRRIGVPRTTPIVTWDNKADKTEREHYTAVPYLEDVASAGDENDHDDMQEEQGNMEERKKSYHEARSLLVSVKTKEGLRCATDHLESVVLSATARKMYRFRLPIGGAHITALRAVVGGAVQETACSGDVQKTVALAAMTDKQLAAFKKKCRET